MGVHMLAAAVAEGQYLNAYKAIPIVLVLLAWAKALSWADKDADNARLPREWLNAGMLTGFVVAFAAFIFVPVYLLALLAMLVIIAAEVGVYLSMRKKTVGLSDLKTDFNLWLRSIGRKEKAVAEVAGAVQLVGPTGTLLAAPPPGSPEAESYDGIQRMLTEPLKNSAEFIELAPAENGSSVRYSVDGVSYPGTSLSKTVAADALGYLKAAAGLDIAEARKPQKGNLKVNLNGARRELALETKGSTAGESARFVANVKSRHDYTPETLGMTPEQIATLKQVSDRPGGITLLSAPRGMGLTSLEYGVLRSHDAFLKQMMTVERGAEQDLEGINQNKLSRNATPAEEQKLVAWILSQEPDVLLVSKPESADSAAAIIAAAATHRMYVSFNAGSTFDALAAWRKLVGNDALAMSQLQLIISGRPVRKLCSACKQAYSPDPEMLRKMNMDAAKVTELFQARKEAPRDPKGNPIKCDFCNDLRYKGRVGMYEFLLVDDAVKQVVMSGTPTEQTNALLKTAFRKQRGRYLQEAGLALVERGETAVQEVLRVMKAGDGAGGAGGVPRTPRSKPPAGPAIVA